MQGSLAIDCLEPTDDVTNISAINWTTSVAPCPGYLYHPRVFIRVKANLVRLWIFSINSHTSERLIKGLKIPGTHIKKPALVQM